LTFIIGQPASGKTTLANFLVKSTNSNLVDAGKIHGVDDESRVKELTKVLDKVRIGQKVIVEDFPHNENQAYLFSKNYQPPVKLVYLECPFSECLDNERKKPLNQRRSVVQMQQKSQKLYQNLKAMHAFYGKNNK